MLPFAARPGLLPTRRDWLAAGVPLLLAPAARATAQRAKSVIVVFASGGQSQLETWDPKPDAPAEIRGAFGSIPTRVPGLRFCEHLPRTAALADQLAVVRSMTHDDLDHGSACYLALTGRFHPRKSSNPDPSPADYPALGAVLRRLRPDDRVPHTAVHVNGPLLAPITAAPGQYGGFLGRGFAPFEAGDPTAPGLADALAPADRADTRRRLLERLDRSAVPAADHAAVVGRAFDVLRSPAAAAAFDLSREPDRVRDRYGRHRSGQACLLARRLVEAGVPWVTVFFNPSIRGQDDHPDDTDAYGWDTHNDIFAAMRDHLLPRFDHSFSALLDDLRQRGLLDSTLVVAMGEFGRAPRVALEKNFVGTSPGRKHWAGCYSVVLAGGGVRGGAVWGASDRHAGYPSANPVAPGDLAATLFHAIGADPGAHYADALGRPAAATTGRPLTGLFG